MTNPTILLIDDDEFLRRFLGLALKKAGYQILEAADGESGLKLAEEKKPAAIICDQVMPGISGEETLKRLRKLAGHAKTPFLLVSGDDVKLPSEECTKALKKPVDKAKLAEWLEKQVPIKKAA